MRHAKLLGFVSVLCTACAGEIGGSLTQGLNIFSEDGQLTGAYVKGTRAIYFETRRGPETLEGYRVADPTTPPYEVDVRVLDAQGRTLYLQVGGHAPIDPMWAKELKADRSKASIDPLDRAEDFQLVKELSGKLEHAAIGVAMAPERRAMVDVGLSVRDTMLRPSLESQLAEKGYAPQWGTIEIHKKWLGWPIAEHSATWSTDVWGGVVNNCNHGTCASSMGRKCTAWGDYYHIDWICHTGYDWNSGGGGHNCHDDTLLQVGSFQGEDRTWEACYDDDSGAWSAPGCDQSHI